MQYSQRRPNRRDRSKAQVRKAIMVLALLAVAMGVLGYFYLNARAAIRPVDEATFCPTDTKGPNSVTAVLIDRTDNFNPTQQAALRDRLNDLRDRGARFDLLEIYTVESTKDNLLKPEFSMCNPGRGEDINQWTGNPHLVEEKWQTLFAAPLQHLFDSILDTQEAQISPIMESIQSIVVTRLGSQDLVAKKIPRKLIIISDLLQYVKNYSQYKPVGSFDSFLSTPYYQNVRADLTGISVEFWYLRRQKTLKLQGEKHVDFWRDYIQDQGGNVYKVWFVPGT
jgi:hypothetical protein